MAGRSPNVALRLEESSEQEDPWVVRDRLLRVGWDFPERTPDPLESIHPYPAKFVAQMPRAVFEAVRPDRGTLVFDPFVGSGTTLTEAQRAGLPSVGVDLNPIACLVARVKTAPLPEGFDKIALGVLDNALGIEADVPDIPRLDHWFRSDVQQGIANLLEAIKEAPPEAQDHLRLALSSIIVRVSNQDSDTRYAAVRKNVSERSVYDAYAVAVVRLARALQGRTYPYQPAKVIQADTLTLEPSDIGGRVGLVVTSPPYPNAYEYWLYHKYRMWWLGFDAEDVKEKEIGARPHFFKKNGHTKHDFLLQMQRTFALISRVSVPRAYAVFVVGRSKIHGEIVDNAEVLREAASASGFDEIVSVERVIQATRKSFNLHHANIKTETVLTFRLGS